MGLLFTIFLQKIKHSTVKHSEPFTEIVQKPSKCKIKTVDRDKECEKKYEWRVENTCPNCDRSNWTNWEWQCTSKSRKCVNPCWWGCETCWDECNWEFVPVCGKGCEVIRKRVCVACCGGFEREVKHEEGRWVDENDVSMCGGMETWYNTCEYNNWGDCERDEGNDMCVKRKNNRNGTPPSYEKKIFFGLNKPAARGWPPPTNFECSTTKDCQEKICDCKLEYSSDCENNCKKKVERKRRKVGGGKNCSHKDVRADVGGNEEGAKVNCRRNDGTCDCKGITLPCSINCETGSNRFIVTQKKRGGGFNCDYPSDCKDGDGVCDSNRLKNVDSGGSWPNKINTTDELNKARQIIIPPWVGELMTEDELNYKTTIVRDKKSKLKKIHKYDLKDSGGSCVDDVYGGSVVGSYMYKIEGNNRDLYRKCDGLYDSNGNFVGNYTF